jgi:hypothetical protein
MPNFSLTGRFVRDIVFPYSEMIPLKPATTCGLANDEDGNSTAGISHVTYIPNRSSSLWECVRLTPKAWRDGGVYCYLPSRCDFVCSRKDKTLQGCKGSLLAEDLLARELNSGFPRLRSI